MIAALIWIIWPKTPSGTVNKLQIGPVHSVMKQIILVTSDYHMPRSKIEIATAMHGIQIIPYPVKTIKHDGDAPWWGGAIVWKRLFAEYGKLLISFAREPGARPSRKQELNQRYDTYNKQMTELINERSTKNLYP